MADVFISYTKGDVLLVVELARDLDAKGYSTWWDRSLRPGDEFSKQIESEIEAAQAVIVIWTESSVSSTWVRGEAQRAHENDKLITVHSEGLNLKLVPIPSNALHSSLVTDLPRICAALEGRGIRPRGKQSCNADHSSTNTFNYEKDIIEHYRRLYAPKDDEEGLPPEIAKILGRWPDVERQKFIADENNPLIPSIGKERRDDAYVSVSALQSKDGQIPDRLSFPEAGPRKNICFPRTKLSNFKVAILVSGGIAPGINAVIDGIVQRHWLYADKGGYANRLQILGLRNGVAPFFRDFNGSYSLLADHPKRVEQRDKEIETSSHAHEGGSILRDIER